MPKSDYEALFTASAVTASVAYQTAAASHTTLAIEWFVQPFGRYDLTCTVAQYELHRLTDMIHIRLICHFALHPFARQMVGSSVLDKLRAGLDEAVYPEVPIRVEYELADVGHSLLPIIVQLTDWAQNNMKSIMAKRKLAEGM